VSSSSPNSSDPFELNRFERAQRGVYESALAEVKRGRKTSHWMWYIFPQFAGLGYSSTSKLYAIKSLAEARAYLAHPILGPRLIESVEAALTVDNRSAHDIFGSPDDSKFHSCVTLFARVSPSNNNIFQQALNKYFVSQPNAATLNLLQGAP